MSNRERFYEIDQIPGTRQQLLERLASHRFENAGQMVGPQYELPGLWFSAQDIHALLRTRQPISNLHVGDLFGPELRPMLTRLTAPIGSADRATDEERRRIRIPTVGALEFRLDQSCCGPARRGRQPVPWRQDETLLRHHKGDTRAPSAKWRGSFATRTCTVSLCHEQAQGGSPNNATFHEVGHGGPGN